MTRLSWFPGPALILAAALGFLIGCSRGVQSPQERAKSLFLHSQFDAALQACDEAMRLTDQPQELADLQLLRGRCFVDQAHRLRAQKQDEAATAKLGEAIAAFTRSIESMDNAEAYYCRSLAHGMMGHKDLALKDGEAARNLDETYAMAYINEPVEEPIDLHRADKDKDENKAADSKAQAAADRSSAGTSEETDVESGGFDWTSSATGESAAATGGAGPAATRWPAAGVSAPQRESAGQRMLQPDAGGTARYRGLPPSAGELSGAVPRTQPGSRARSAESPAGQGMSTGRTTAGGGRPADSKEEAEGQAQAEDLADDSSDTPPSEENPPAEPTESPRPPAIWPPPAFGPWSATPQPPGMSLPTTGLGGAPAWGMTPYSAGVPLPQIPTTGIVGPSGLSSPWTSGLRGVGAAANPFAPSTGIGSGFWPPGPVPPGLPRAPAPTGLGTIPTTPLPGVGPLGPMVGPTPPRSPIPSLPPQSLPTTGVQRSVSPYPD